MRAGVVEICRPEGVVRRCAWDTVTKFTQAMEKLHPTALALKFVYALLST
jgi:hypothetical protein